MAVLENLLRLLRLAGAFYAFACCWVPLLWLRSHQMERYGFYQHEFRLLNLFDQVALVCLAALALVGTLAVVSIRDPE